MKYRHGHPFLFLFLPHPQESSLCSQPIRGNVRRTGRIFPEHVEQSFLDPEYSFVTVGRIPRSRFAKQMSVRLRTNYVGLGLTNNPNYVRPVKNGLYGWTGQGCAGGSGTQNRFWGGCVAVTKTTSKLSWMCGWRICRHFTPIAGFIPGWFTVCSWNKQLTQCFFFVVGYRQISNTRCVSFVIVTRTHIIIITYTDSTKCQQDGDNRLETFVKERSF